MPHTCKIIHHSRRLKSQIEEGGGLSNMNDAGKDTELHQDCRNYRSVGWGEGSGWLQKMMVEL